MDLDLSTLTKPPAPLIAPEELVLHPAGQATPQGPQPGMANDPLAANVAAVARIAYPETQMTQTPTEVSIDIDVGEPSHPSSAVGPPGTRVVPLQRPDAERKAGAPALAPFDLQLDLDQPETGTGGPKPREEKSA